VLGTLNIKAPTTVSTTFTLADFSNADGDFITFLTDATGLESLSAASGGGLFGQSLTINITAVPEPSSFLLAGIAVGGMGIWRLRRNDRSKT
jgi:hypothetical protein